MALLVGELVANLTINDAGFKSSMGNAKSSLKNLSTGMKSTGMSMTRNLTAPIIAIGTAAIMTLSKFDDAMSKVSAISGVTGESLKRLREQAKELGSTTAHSATAAADAMSYLALAGWDVNQILKATPSMLALASAGALDLATAADIVSDTMSAFGIAAEDAGKTADIFAQGQRKSNTSVLELGEAIKFAGGAANAAGMTLAQTTTILGIFADNMLKGSMGGTVFSNVLKDLQENAKDGAIQIGEMAIQVFRADGSMRDMGSILKDVVTATKDMTAEQKLFATSNVFSIRSMRGVNAFLTAGSKRYDELEGHMHNVNDVAIEMASTMEDNLGGGFRSLKSAIEGMLIELGENLGPLIKDTVIPLLIKMTKWINGVIEKFGELDPKTQKIILVLIGVAAAAGPVIVLLGALASAIAAIIAGGTVTLVLAGIAAAIFQISLVVTAGISAWKMWGNKIIEVIQGAIDALADFVRGIPFIGAKMAEALDKIDVTKHAAKIGEDTAKVIAVSMENAGTAIIAVGAKIGEDTVNAVADSITDNLPTITKAAKGMSDAIKKQLKSDIEDYRDSILSREQLEIKAYNKKLKRLDEAEKAGIELKGGYDKLRADLEKKHSEKIIEIREKVADDLNGKLVAEYGIIKAALASKEELEITQYEKDLETLVAYHETGLMTDTEFLEMKFELSKTHLEKMRLIKEENAKVIDGIDVARTTRELNRLKDSYKTETELENDRYTEKLQLLNDSLKIEKITVSEHKALMEKIETEHINKMTEIREKNMTDLEKFTAMSYGQQAKTVAMELANITGSVSKENRTMFKINKAAAIANAIMNAYTGISKTMSAYPFPINIAMAAAHTAAAFAQVNAIKSASFAKGGIVTGRTFAEIGEGFDNEAVIPLNKNTLGSIGDQIAASSGSMGRTANIIIYLDGEVIAEAIKQPLIDDILIKTGVRV